MTPAKNKRFIRKNDLLPIDCNHAQFDYDTFKLILHRLCFIYDFCFTGHKSRKRGGEKLFKNKIPQVLGVQRRQPTQAQSAPYHLSAYWTDYPPPTTHLNFCLPVLLSPALAFTRTRFPAHRPTFLSVARTLNAKSWILNEKWSTVVAGAISEWNLLRNRFKVIFVTEIGH